MWPPRSPDLNPCDFYLWGYLKSVVCNPLPKALDDLKGNIVREMKKNLQRCFKFCILNLEKRGNSIISADGGHLEEK